MVELLGRVVTRCLGEDSPPPLVAAEGGESPRNIRLGVHSHRSWESFIVLEGGVNFEAVSAAMVGVPAGAMLLVPPGLMHMEINRLPQSPPFELCVMVFPHGDAFHGSFRYYDEGLPHSLLLPFSARQAVKWRSLLGGDPKDFLERAAKAAAGGTWGELRSRALIKTVLGALAEAVLSSPETGEGGGEPDDLRLARAAVVMDQEYANPAMDVDHLARVAGLSTSYFSNRYKKQTGKSVRQALIELRLSRALDMLETGRYSVKEVAAVTGWSNQLYFSAAFKRRFGASPRGYRHEN